MHLNPPDGLDTIDLADFTRGADIEAITNQYLENPDVIEQVSNIAVTLIVSRSTLLDVMQLANLGFQDAVAHLLHSSCEGHSLPPNILHSINNDAAFNSFSGNATSGFTVVLPKFTKELLAIRTKILLDADTHAACCDFNLVGWLGLLRGQSNEMLGQFETVTMNDLVHNGTTYFSHISRHCLVLLISEHLQELWQVDNWTYASTNIGQFTFYEYEGCSVSPF